MLKQRLFSTIFFILFSILPLNSKKFGGSFNEFIKNSKNPEEISFFLENVSFESDVPFSKPEFSYLTDLKPQTIVTKKDIDLAYKNLMSKKRFLKTEIDISDGTEGKILHFKLTGNWIFKKLKLRGIWFGKYNYENYYIQQSGDVFDMDLHEESIQNIKTHLHDKGYFDCKVQHELIYDKKDKSITTELTIKKRSCYVMKSISFKIIPDSTQNKILEKKLISYNNKLHKKIALSFLNTYYSKNFLKKGVEKIRRFFKKRGFANNRVSVKRLLDKDKKRVQIIFEIKLEQRRKLSFIGNKVFTKKQIIQNILGLDFPSWLFSPEIIAEQLLHEYKDKGYWDAKIKYKKIAPFEFEFTITENNPINIEAVQILDENNKRLSRRLIFFTDLLKKKFFDEELLNKAIEDLKNFYTSKGFWDFEINNKKFLRDSNTKQYTVLLNVKKGKQRFWDNFKISQFPELEKDPFFTKYVKEKHKKLLPFNFFWLQEQRTFLINHFQKQGYWYVEAQPELSASLKEEKPGKIFVSIDWKIDLGTQIKFGKILINGNTKLPFKRILKEIQFKQGDLWDRKKLDQTRKRLKKLDIFKDIQIQPYKMAKNKNKADQPIMLNLVDDDPLQASLRLGYFATNKNFMFRQESTYRVGASLLIKNPTNHADKASLNADLTRFERKLNLDYQILSPFGLTFGDAPVVGKTKIYANKYVHPVKIRDSDSAFEAFQTGFSFGVNNEYKQNYFWGINFGNEWLRTSRVRGDLKFSENLINKTLPFAFIEPTIIVDKLDDKIDVKKGSLTFCSLKLMVPENKGCTTGKITFEQSLFYPLYKDIIGGVRLRLGHIFRREFDQIQPIERFFLGGPYSVRGYEKDALPPLGVTKKIKQDDKNPNEQKAEKQYTIQGGSSMLNANLEVRFPIYKSFRGVLFQDVGVLSQTGFMGVYGKWYPSTGFGLRYKTPIGAIRFDIGWKWKKILPHDTSYAWYLTLGEAF